MSAPAMMRFCRSRNAGRRCTRELDHRGLHRHRTILWSDAGAEPPRCTGSGAPAAAAATLASGFPDGRALCETCLGFVALDAEGRLIEHDTWNAEAEADAGERADWFNTFGWSSGD